MKMMEILVSRSKSNAMIVDPKIAQKHVIKMVENQAINCYSGKQIPCEIDSICVHGDGTKCSKYSKTRLGMDSIKAGVTLKTIR